MRRSVVECGAANCSCLRRSLSPLPLLLHSTAFSPYLSLLRFYLGRGRRCHSGYHQVSIGRETERSRELQLRVLRRKVEGRMAEEDATHHQTEVKIEDIQNFDDGDVLARKEKYSRYKAEYARRIKAKYFSKKSPNGVNVFEKETSIDDELIKSSRCPCTKHFIECVNDLEDSSKPSGAVADAAASTPPRKALSKK